MTVADQVVVHELAPVIRMDAQEWEREAAANTSQGSEDLFLTLVPHCPGLGPPCCHVGDVQGAGILSSGDATFMGHQVHGDEPRPGTVPLRSSLDRDLPQEEHAGAGMRVFPGFLLRTHVLEQPVTGGRTHAEKEVTDSRSKVKLSPGLEEGDDALQVRDESLAAESVRQMPELRERREDRPLVDGCPMAMDGTPALRPLRPQGAAGIRTVEMCQIHEFVQDLRFLLLRCVAVLFPQLLHHRLPLLHGQSHLLTSPLLILFHGSSSVYWIGVDLSVRQRCDLE